jgi:hypothetical protein
MKNILYYIFGLFIITSCTPNQDENGDLLKGVDYETNTNNGGSGTTTRLLKQVKSHTKNEDTENMKMKIIPIIIREQS